MAKESGLGDALYLAGYNVSGDIQQLGKVAGGPAALDMTGIDKLGMERQGGIRDGGIDYTGWFNPGPEANALHLVASTLPTTDVVGTYCRGTTLGGPAACLVAKQANYDPKRANDGALTFEVSLLANGYGVEWGRLLTAGIRADTAATNGSSVDYGATIGTTAHGLQAYLHVFAFTGTSATVKIQESSDDGVGDTWADVVGGSFDAQSAIGASRIETARGLSVERYLRVVTTGTFTSCQFAVVVMKNETATVT